MEESIEWDRDDAADIRVYTDSSGFEGYAGAAAILYRGSAAPKSLRLQLGMLADHTPFEAEVTGLLLGAHLLCKESQLSTITINTDSQAALLALDIRKPKPGQYLINKFLRTMERLGTVPCQMTTNLSWHGSKGTASQKVMGRPTKK